MPRQPVVTFRELDRVLGPAVAGLPTRGGPESASGEAEAAAADDPRRDAAMKLIGRAMQEIERADAGDGLFNSVSDDVGSLLQTYLAQQADEADAVPLPMGGFEAKFDTRDVAGWVGSFFDWWRKIRPHPWVDGSDDIADLGGGELRIGMLADWGTGLYGAPECARALDSDAAGFDLLIHLGDVYYSGTNKEIEERFLPYWPRNARLAHLALNANHEMYSGGWGYFDTTVPAVAGFSKAYKQKASYFAVANKHFTLVGLDTGYKDNDLAGDQAAWLERVVAKSEAAGRRTILMSHHQPFSAFDGNGDAIVEKLASLLGRKKIFAWYFGHEHRLVVYDRHPDWDVHGRCLGHGGMPYFRDKVDGGAPETTAMYRIAGRTKGSIRTPPGLLLDGPNPYVGDGRLKYGPNGYLVLTLSGKGIEESYRLPDGRIVHEATLT